MKKTSILVLLCVIFQNCNSQKKYNYVELLELKPTHIIESKDVKNSLKELIVDNNYYGEFDTEVIVIKTEKKMFEYEICITVTDFKIFKDYRPEIFEKLKGYSKFNEIPVLLFGDIDSSSFFKNLDNRFYDVVGPLPIYDKDNPPTIYDPKIVCFSK